MNLTELRTPARSRRRGATTSVAARRNRSFDGSRLRRDEETVNASRPVRVQSVYKVSAAASAISFRDKGCPTTAEIQDLAAERDLAFWR